MKVINWESFKVLGTRLSADLWRRVDECIHLPRDQWQSIFVDRPRPEAVVRVWCQILNTKIFDLDVLTLLLWQIAEAVAEGRSHFQIAFASSGLNALRSEVEINLRLGATLFKKARHVPPERSQARIPIFREAISCFELVRRNDRSLGTNERARVTYLGMGGVCRLLLLRETGPDLTILQEAAADLELAERKGDRTPDHFGFLLEAYLESYDCTGDSSFIDAAESTIARMPADVRGVHCGLELGLGEVHLRRSYMRRESDSAGAITELRRAIEHFEMAAAVARPFDQEFAVNRRGQAKYRLAVALLDVDASEATQVGTSAVQDLRFGKAVNPSRTVTLANALALVATTSPELSRGTRVELLNEAANLSVENLDTWGAVDTAARVKQCLCEETAWLHIEAGDRQGILQACHDLLSFLETSDISVAPLFHGIRWLLLQEPCERAAELALAVLEFAASRRHEERRPTSSKIFLLSHTSGIALILGKEPAWAAHVKDRDRKSLLARAASDGKAALELGEGPAAPELLGYVGEAALRLAKESAASGDESLAADFFRDAISHLRELCALGNSLDTSRWPTINRTVSHSKLGEALLRLSSLRGDDELAEQALFHLYESTKLGNEEPENYGLLADAHYRVGRLRDDVSHLKSAIELKEQAYRLSKEQRGGIQRLRENRSIASRANLALWELTRESCFLVQGLKCLLEAHVEDVSWPWIHFCLADLARLPENLRQEAASVLCGVQAQELLNMFAAGDHQELVRVGCQLLIRSTEFSRSSLGGSKPVPVFVLDDPHRLLNRSYVIKTASLAAARREIGTASELKQFLRQIRAPSTLKLPQVLLIEEHSTEEVTYALRYIRGRQLGAAIHELEPGEAARGFGWIENAVRFLAIFHGWAYIEKRRPDERDVTRTWSTLQRRANGWADLGHDYSEVAKWFAGRAEDKAALCFKKDAHPENWLVTDADEIVMIDLENHGWLPLPYDLVQLLEDYPFFPHTAAGWKQRERLLGIYLEQLTQLGCTELVPPFEVAVQMYQNQLASRAAVALPPLLSRRWLNRTIRSSAALRLAKERRDHYVAALKYLSGGASDPGSIERAVFVKDLLRLLQGEGMNVQAEFPFETG